MKFKLWSPKFTNRPDIEPPMLLKIVGTFSILSAIGFLFYAVGAMLATYGVFEPELAEAGYVALVHFILPVGVFYTVTINSPFSRYVLSVHVIVLGGMTIAGKGVLGQLPISEATRIGVSAGIIAVVLGWLYGNPKMRFYYAVISGRAIPEDLRPRVEELRGGLALNPKVRAAVEWFVDHMELAVMLGFIALVLAMVII